MLRRGEFYSSQVFNIRLIRLFRVDIYEIELKCSTFQAMDDKYLNILC